MPTTGTITGNAKRAGANIASRPVTIASLNNAIVSVSPLTGITDASGNVSVTATAVAAGSATVRFTCDGLTADSSVTVTAV